MSNVSEINQGQALGSDLEDAEFLDIEPYDGEPDFAMSGGTELGAQDDDTDPEDEPLEDDDA